MYAQQCFNNNNNDDDNDNDNNNNNNNNILPLGALKQSLYAIKIMQVKESS